MKMWRWALVVAVGLFAVHPGLAQAPAGSTGQCRDGSYTNAASRSGACRGHKGVQTWFAAVAPAAASVTATSTTTTAKTGGPVASMPVQQAAAGPGMVWVNTATKVYHCPGTKYYGKTKEGKYMSEAEAKASGARPGHGKACSR